MRDNHDGFRAATRFDMSIRPDFGPRAPFIEVSGHHRFDGSFNAAHFGHRSYGHATFEMGSQLDNRHCLPSMQVTDQRYNSWGRRNPYAERGYDRGYDRAYDRVPYSPNIYGRGTFNGGICQPDSWQRHPRSLNTFFDSRQPERYHDIPRLKDRPWMDDRTQCTFGGGDRYARVGFRLPFVGFDMQVATGPRDMTYHGMRGMRGYGRPPYPCPEVHPTCRIAPPRQEAPQYYSPQNHTMRRISYTPDAVQNQPEQPQYNFKPQQPYKPQQSYRPQPVAYNQEQNVKPQPAVYQPEQRNLRPQPAAYQPEQSIQNSATSKLNNTDFVDRVIANISAHEGNFTSINKNDAGYGISIGIRQWNQKAGELPVLMKAWNRQDPQKFQQVFGPYAQQLLNDKWVRSYDMANDDQFMSRMKTALADKEFQDVQVSESRAFVKRNMELAHSYGFKSELGVALICDMVNHMGSGGTEKALKKIGLVKGGQIADERRAVERLSSVRPNGQMYYAMLDKKFSSDVNANQNAPYIPNQRANPNIAYA